MKISIALCTYNGEKFLREQLNSIARQTLLPDELVVCDDCSSDSTMEILKEFRERVPFPVHIYRNEINLGSTKNFEKAIGLCSCDIIALCDQDDIWKPHKLERLEEVLRANPDAGYVFSDAQLVDDNRKPLGYSLWESIGFRGKIRERFIQGDQFRCFLQQHIVTGATMAFRASVGRLAMPFPSDGLWIHDGWIVIIASATGAIGIPLHEPLVAYRQHAGQQIGAPEPSKMRKTNLYEKYLELKAATEYLFGAWESRCIQVLEVKGKLQQLAVSYPTVALKRNLEILQEFETHFLTRRKILTSKNIKRYGLILREAFSGRYAQFSDSWRSIFRDMFL